MQITLKIVLLLCICGHFIVSSAQKKSQLIFYGYSDSQGQIDKNDYGAVLKIYYKVTKELKNQYATQVFAENISNHTYRIGIQIQGTDNFPCETLKFGEIKINPGQRKGGNWGGWWGYLCGGKKENIEIWIGVTSLVNVDAEKVAKKRKEEERKRNPEEKKLLADAKKKQKDDFWNSGKKSKTAVKNENAKNKAGDFWNSGADRQSDVSNSNDFWSGSDHEYFLEQERKKFAKEGKKLLSAIRTKSKKVIITAWDHGKEDGDEVAFYINNKFLDDLLLKKSKRKKSFQLSAGRNVIEIKALNEGSSSPNTASFIVEDESGKEIESKKWELNEGEKAVLLVYKIN